jgi:hypothetical protein
LIGIAKTQIVLDMGYTLKLGTIGVDADDFVSQYKKWVQEMSSQALKKIRKNIC